MKKLFKKIELFISFIKCRISSFKQQRVSPNVKSLEKIVYLTSCEEFFSVSATKGRFNQAEEEEFFREGIQNFSGKKWCNVITGCYSTSAGKVNAKYLENKGRYSNVVENVSGNFFKGIKHALQTLKEKENDYFVKLIYEYNYVIHIPFKNAFKNRFVAKVTEYRGELNVEILPFSYTHVWLLPWSIGDCKHMFLLPPKKV